MTQIRRLADDQLPGENQMCAIFLTLPWDRLLGLNLIAAKVLTAIVLLASLLGESYLLDIALVYAVLGFIGTVLIARFFERREGP